MSELHDSYFKVLDKNGTGQYTDFRWPLPNGAMGEWVEVEGELVVCQNGLHLCRSTDLVYWLGPQIFIAESSGEILESDNKTVHRRARLVRRLDTWNEHAARLFAADCAERVLHIFEQRRPNDTRPREAINAARAFARGEIDNAARAAARAAAGAAAWAAAGDAAGDAARAAAWAAAEAAERTWQTDRLFEYIEEAAS